MQSYQRQLSDITEHLRLVAKRLALTHLKSAELCPLICACVSNLLTVVGSTNQSNYRNQSYSNSLCCALHASSHTDNQCAIAPSANAENELYKAVLIETKFAESRSAGSSSQGTFTLSGSQV